MVSNNETILVISGVNEAELLRTLCWFDKPQFGLRVMNATELAQRAMISSGIVLNKRCISKSEQIGVMIKALEKSECNYFSSDYESVRCLSESVDMLRMRVPVSKHKDIYDKLKNDGAAEKSEVFAEKNEALLEAYNRYLDECEKSHVIDSISLITAAVSMKVHLDDIKLLTLEEYPLEPAEKELVQVLGHSEEISLAQLFGAYDDKKQKPELFSTYGEYNEALHILDEILDKQNGTSFDKCTVAVADTSLYSQLFFELGTRFGIKMTFGCGIPFSNTNPAQFLTRLKTWCTQGKYSLESLKAFVLCGAFDRKKLTDSIIGEKTLSLLKVIELAGKMRLGFNGNENIGKIEKLVSFLDPDDKHDAETLLYIEPLKLLSQELSQGAAVVLRKYCSIRKSEFNALDISALNEAVKMMNEYADATGKDAVDVIPMLMKKNVCCKSRKEGALHITSIDKAAFSLRNRLFIAGLCANNFPGTAREDAIVLDCDIALFDTSPQAPTSDNLIKQKTQRALSLVKLANALGNRITLSYAYFSAAELKPTNMSSSVTRMYNCLCDKADMRSYKQLIEGIKTYSYFDDSILADRLIGKDFCAGKLLAEKEIPEAKDEQAVNCFNEDRYYSPSAINQFYECPRKFFLGRVLGIHLPQYSDDNDVIPINEQGTIIHKCMQDLAQSNFKMGKEEYMQLCKKYVEKYLSMNIPAAGVTAENTERDMKWIAEKAFEDDLKEEKTVPLAEDKARAVNDASGVKIEGYPDRVEYLVKTKQYLVGDYKTGKKKKQVDDQPKTWLQTMCYAYIMEHLRDDEKRVNISKCEYRYPRIGQTCVRDYKQSEIDAILKEFRECLEKQVFPPVTNKDSANPAIEGGDCSFCDFIDICGKGKK